MRYEVEVNGEPRPVNIRRSGSRFVVSRGDREWTVDIVGVGRHTWSLLVGHESYEAYVNANPVTGQCQVLIGSTPLAVVVNRRKWSGRGAGAHVGRGPQRVVAPMPGKIVRVPVQVGDAVVARQTLAVIEAMKMENELRAGGPGIVSEVLVREGQSVDAGTLLLVVASS